MRSQNTLLCVAVNPLNTCFLVFTFQARSSSFTYHQTSGPRMRNEFKIGMEQGYVLEWLDLAINEFNPTQTQSANFEDHRFRSFSEEVLHEQARQIAYLRKLAFHYPKKRKFQEVLESYFSALNNLIDIAKRNLKLIASESAISKKALELAVASLADIHSFLLNRYTVSINPDEPLRKHNLAVPVIDFAQPADNILLSYHPALASLIGVEFNAVFNTGNLANITIFLQFRTATH